jgi:hypothetical protein
MRRRSAGPKTPETMFRCSLDGVIDHGQLDYEIELGRLSYRQFGGLGPAQNFVDKSATCKKVGKVGPS